ncbi:uncharacterized protein LOC142326561 [Lycorma delicatula]|uniref:uncharacterized protein LOC142326561 n=1 Tax=Lycorma delicatula TaxID=130591 RepID=UPI003F516FD8
MKVYILIVFFALLSTSMQAPNDNIKNFEIKKVNEESVVADILIPLLGLDFDSEVKRVRRSNDEDDDERSGPGSNEVMKIKKPKGKNYKQSGNLINAPLLKTSIGDLKFLVNKNPKTDYYNAVLVLETKIKNPAEILKLLQQMRS